MTQELAQTPTRQVGPPRPAPELSAATRNLVCWIPSDPNEPVGLTRLLAGDERQRIENRIAEIEASLAQRNARSVERSIAAMMLSIPSGRASGDEARAIVSAYVATLGDMPPWAVERAAMRFAGGEVTTANPAFAPSGAEVRKETDRLLVPYRAEIMRLRQILGGVARETISRSTPTPKEQAA